MCEEPKVFSDLEMKYQQQNKEIEKLKLQLWDTEEENRVLYRNIEKQKKELEAKEEKISVLEEEYTDLKNIVKKNLWLVFKRMIVKAGRKIIILLKNIH